MPTQQDEKEKTGVSIGAGTGSISDILDASKLICDKVSWQGSTISKGHKNYELMLNLQLGVRHSVGRPAPVTSLDLKSTAFDPRDKVDGQDFHVKDLSTRHLTIRANSNGRITVHWFSGH